jgi:3-oxoacyl-[acyl-carrier protein] reductase
MCNDCPAHLPSTALTTVRFGRLDILVNDAAYNKSIPFADLDNLTLEVWDKIMAVNLPHRQHRVGGRARANGLVHRVRGVEGGPHPPHPQHGSGVSAGDARQLCRTGTAEGKRATSNLRPEQIERSASGSLLKKAADKDDCADMVAAMCRTETMTGQTVVIDSGRLFH